jgi:putative CocE/NonD family hydrolase
VSSDAPDTDLVARLVDVFPDGRAIGIQEGALRLRYRDGFEHPVMMRPGERYEATVDMRAIAYAFAPGHRLRLQVTSSSFPRLERNLNTGAANNSAETAMRVATNRVWHDASGGSRLVLYVLPTD